jgi:hypothetical protein
MATVPIPEGATVGNLVSIPEGATIGEPVSGNQPSGISAGGGTAKSYAQMALQNSPSGADPHNPGNPNLNAVPESERAGVNDAALGTQAGVLAGQGAAAGAEALGAKALNSALSYLGLGAKTAKTAQAAGEVATGLVDQHGNPIMRAVQAAEPEVRPMLQKLLAHPAVQAGLKEAGKDLLKSAGFGAGYEVLHHLF